MIIALEQTKPKLLLHTCCGPCAGAVIERLVPRFEVHCLWYNPNIQPQAEYQRRLEAMRTVAEAMDVPLIEAERDEAEWEEAIAGLEEEPEGGRRCAVCFHYRLARTAQYAVGHGFTHIATSLGVGPHKNIEAINGIGRRQADGRELDFVDENFRKHNGFQRSVQLSKQLHLYRQNYCGCRYSQRQ